MTRPLTIFVLHPSHYFTDHHPHGDGLIAFGFIENLARRGHEIHVAVPLMDVRQPLPPNVHLHPIRTWNPPSAVYPSAPHRLEYAWRAAQLFGKLRRSVAFDVIHQFNPVVTGLNQFLHDTGVPVVAGPVWPPWTEDMQGAAQDKGVWAGLKTSLREGAQRRQYRHMQGVLTPTPASSSLLSHLGVPEDRLFQVNIGVDANVFHPSPENESPTGPPTILFLANLLARKGIFTLLEAFAEVAREIPECRLAVAGSGPEEARVRSLVARMEAGQRIDLIGNVSRSEVAPLLRRSTVYCLPSYGEPFGMSALEAMACGKPLVVTDAGGLKWLLAESGGRRVPPRDPTSLAGALCEVLRSPALQCRMGQENWRRVQSLYSWEAVTRQLEETYVSVMRRHPVRSKQTVMGTAGLQEHG